MKYIVILRGINVSGKNIFKMSDFRGLCEEFEFKNSKTYIQSGNIVFESCEKNKKKLNDKLKNGIFEKYGFETSIFIYTKIEIEKIIKECPFDLINDNENIKKIYVTFLRDLPLKEEVNNLEKHLKNNEQMFLVNKIIYLYCPNRYARFKLTNTFIEKKLNMKATTRNWRTVNKLYDLSKD